MKPTDITAPQGQVARADLLRALAIAPLEHLALDSNAQGWFGYVWQAPAETPTAFIQGQTTEQKAPPTELGGDLPLQMPFVYAEVERQPLPPPAPDAPPPPNRAVVEPMTEERAAAPSPQRQIRYEDLVSQARLVPALRRYLTTQRPGALNIARLTQHLAEGALPRHLPRHSLQRWHPDVVLVLDFSPRLWPYREDMHRLAERLLQQGGRSHVSLRVLKYGPLGPWVDWHALQNRKLFDPRASAWAPPRPGTPLLIASDFGLLLGADSATSHDWRAFIAAQTRAGVRAVALAPLGAAQLDARLTSALPVLRWSPDAPLRPARVQAPACATPPGLSELLAMVAATRRVDPPLLRALRQLNPHAPLNAGLEGAVWAHAEVEAGLTANLHAAAREAHLQRFGALQAPLQVALNALRRKHHAHYRAVLNHEETLLWAARMDEAGLSDAAKKQIADAQDFFKRLALTLTQGDGTTDAAGWWQVARDITQRADARMVQRHGDSLKPLVEAAVRRDHGRGVTPQVPDWVAPAMVSAWLEPAGPQTPVPCWLVADAARGAVVLQAAAAGAGAGQSPLGEALLLDAGGARVQVAGGFWRPLSALDLPVSLAPLASAAHLHIETAREVLSVAAIQRPRGIAGWGVTAIGVQVSTAPLAGVRAQWVAAALKPVLKADTRDYTFTADTQVVDSKEKNKSPIRFGIDAEHGAWADVTFPSSHGAVTQRLRWIVPGEFMMGSPETEADHESDEGPQHAVTLSKGYWLADSACTQALWKAVMGKNPSHFTKNLQNPVEQVSWRDTQLFLRKVEQLLPGMLASLPTEAEWEYACRAGEPTPFSFGENITPEQVNYNGNFPYNQGKKGLYRKATVPVKSLLPNAWGLYEMHGNVWEWCADGKREYDTALQRDPLGAGSEGAPRAVRGGSWNLNARFARSAYRHSIDPGDASLYLGFRFCLRSSEPGTGLSGVQGGEGVKAGVKRGVGVKGVARDALDLLHVPDWLKPNDKKKR